ncbi:hypothetical protein EHP00_858 [Ecytonucleospora hepatopenaei]|uniref:Uncharacterized protein n=1 Tax=Ecytonucleospora hepatopenaei TaxID=646526 RepID=A0A1W0E4N7_9MICR|nr:hypothetical protein EHP00_858 [Ecytonucleospora hepatopenaei]
MQLCAKTKIFKIDKTPFAITPMAFTQNEVIKLNFNYHSGLLKLNEGDNVEIKIHFHEKPSNTSNLYLMNGIVYEIGEKQLKCSFGGLLLDYEGEFDDIHVGDKTHITIQKI